MSRPTLPGLVLAFLLAAAAGAQSLDTVLFLPDSFTGPTYPTVVCNTGAQGKVYAAGLSGRASLVVIDARARAKVSRVPLADDVYGLLWNPGGRVVYAIERHSLAAVDCDADTVIARLPLTDAAGAGAWHGPANALYVADKLYGSVLKVSGATHLPLDTIAVRLTPVDIVSCPAQNKVYVAGRQDTVAVIDCATDSVIRLIAAGGQPSDLEPDPDREVVYCANRSDGTVSIIDCRSDTVVAVMAAGQWPSALCLNRARSRLYCAGGSAGRVAVLDLQQRQLVASIPVPAAQALGLDLAGNRLYVGTAGASLAVIDCAGDTVIARHAVPDCRSLCPDSAGGGLFCASYGAGTVEVLSGDSLLSSVQVSSGQPRAVLAAFDRLYVAEERVDRVAVFSLSDLSLRCRLRVPGRPYALCASPASNRVFCALRDSGRVAVIDAATDSLAALIEVGNAPYHLAWDSLDNKVYCAEFGSTAVSVIDCASGSVVHTIPVGRAARRVLYNPVSNKAYVACHDAEAYFIIDCTRDTVTAQVPTSGNPWTACLDRAGNVVYTGTSWAGPIVCGYGDTILGDISDAFYVKGAAWCGRYNYAYLSRNYSSDVLVIDCLTRSVAANLAVPSYPAEAAVVEQSGRVYVCHYRGGQRTNMVSVLEAEHVAAGITVPQSPVDLCVEQARNRVFVACSDDGCVAVLSDGPPGVAEQGSAGPAGRAAATVFSGSVKLASALGRGLCVFDAAGRLVRSLPGREWDGRDEQGRNAAPGVYRVRGPGGTALLVKAR